MLLFRVYLFRNCLWNAKREAWIYPIFSCFFFRGAGFPLLFVLVDSKGEKGSTVWLWTGIETSITDLVWRSEITKGSRTHYLLAVPTVFDRLHTTQRVHAWRSGTEKQRYRGIKKGRKNDQERMKDVVCGPQPHCPWTNRTQSNRTDGFPFLFNQSKRVK